MVSRLSVCSLRDDAQREGKPALVANKQLGEADVVCDKGGDDTKCAARLVACGIVQELACETKTTIRTGNIRTESRRSSLIARSMNVIVRKKNKAMRPMLRRREAILSWAWVSVGCAREA